MQEMQSYGEGDDRRERRRASDSIHDQMEDGGWLARRWSGVHLRVAELVPGAGGGPASTVRAVVQLGTLTPADVRVTAGPTSQTVEASSAEHVRLVSVRSHHNGAVVFEAAAPPRALATATALVVTVSPVPRLLGGGPLPSVVGPVRRAARTADNAALGSSMVSQRIDP